MPLHCSVEGCSSQGTKGVSLFQIPFENDQRSIAKERRKKWLDFISSSRPHGRSIFWTPLKSSRVCSEHFVKDDFERRFDLLGCYSIKSLRKDSVGVVAFPSVVSQEAAASSAKTMSPTKRRMAVDLILKNATSCQSVPQTSISQTEHKKPFEKDHPSSSRKSKDAFMQTDDKFCDGCSSLLKKNRLLRNKIIDLKTKERSAKKLIETLRSDLHSREEDIKKLIETVKSELEKKTQQNQDYIEEDDVESDYDDSVEEEPVSDSDSEYFPSPKRRREQECSDLSDSEDDSQDDVSNTTCKNFRQRR